MPQIPVAQIPGGNVGGVPTPFATVRATPASMGAGVAAGLESLGGQMQVIVDKQKKEDDANRAMEVYAKASERARALMLDEGGLLTRRGKAALGGTREAMTGLDKIYAEVGEEFDNDEQRLAFEALWQRKRESVLDGVSRHEAGERQTYADETTAAMVTTAVTDAADAYDRPEVVDRSIKIAEAAIRQNNRGQAPEVVDRKVEEARSAIRKAVIDRMVIGNPTAAKAYYEQHKKDIDGADHAAIEKVLEVGTTLQSAQEAVDRIMLEHPDDHEAGLAAAREITDPQVRKQTEAMVNQRHAERSAIRSEREREVKREAWQVVESGPGGFDSLTPQQRAALDGYTLAAMERRARQVAEGKDPVTDRLLKYRLERWASEASTRAEFAGMDLMQYKDQLSFADFDYFSKLQMAARGDQANQAELDRTTTYTQLTAEYVRGLKINTGEKATDSDRERFTHFRGRVEQELAEFVTANKRKPSTTEMREVFNRVTMEIRRVDTFLGLDYLNPDDKVRAFEAEIEGIQANEIDELALGVSRRGGEVTFDNVRNLGQNIPGVPGSEARRIAVALVRKGLVPTDASIAAVYQERNR